MTNHEPIELSRLAARLRTRETPVICVGHTAWDETWQVETLPSGGGKIRANGFHEGGGGMAATAAVAVARLGGKARFWGRAGNDRPGRAMRDELASHGVDLSGLRLIDGARSSVSGVVVDARGERSIFNFRGTDLPDDAAWLPLAEIASAVAVLVDPRWPGGALAALRAARAAGVPTVLDGDVADAEIFDALLPWVDCAVFSEPGLAGYAREQPDQASQLRFALSHGCKLAVVTLGECGLAWTDGASVRRLDAFRVDAVDTTGAGDAFHGAFALAIGAGLETESALRFSSAVGALKCTRPGGRAGIPDLETVLAWLERQAGPSPLSLSARPDAAPDGTGESTSLRASLRPHESKESST